MRALACLEVWVLLQLLLHTCLTEGTVGVVTNMKITTNIEHRYAVTRVSTRLTNPSATAAPQQFQLALPQTALVSSFLMEVSGANYTGIIRKKAASRRIYEMAKMRGKTTGLVEQMDDGVQKFVSSVNVAAYGAVTLHITYEELVQRVNGNYLYSVLVHPGYRIPVVEIDVHIMEREEIVDYRILELPGQEMLSHNPGTRVQGGPRGLGELHLHYSHEDPEGGSGRGVDGTFTVAYDVTHHSDGGEVQRVGNYFTHYFSPEGLPKLATHTVFLIDVSFSTHDGQLATLQEALTSVLEGMNATDTFEVLAFSSDVVNVGSFTGEPHQVKTAIRKVKRLVSLGYSNLNAALLQAIRTANSYEGHAVKQIVVFTDGLATSGVTDPDTIRRNVREANSQLHPIFALVFGNDDMKLLDHISTDSTGFAHYVQLGPQLASDIRTFCQQLSKPLLTQLDIRYPEASVDPNTVAKPRISSYYSGGEVVLAGLLYPGAAEVEPVVNGVGLDGPYQFQVTRIDTRRPFHPSLTNNFTARLWAYLFVQDLLARAEASENFNHTRELHAQALHIALRFGFVTKLTSLVVVYPDDEYIVVSPQDQRHHHSNGHPSSYYQSSISSYRRTGRSNIRVDMDPYFIVYAQGLDLPLCFNYHGQNGDIMNLIRDPQSGIIVNGQVTSSVQQPKMTYFTSLFLRLGNVNLTITPDRMEVDCLGEDGTPQVNSITKSLWPFYKNNGRRYKHGPDKRLRASPSVNQTNQKRHFGLNQIAPGNLGHYTPSTGVNHHIHGGSNHYTSSSGREQNIFKKPSSYFSYDRINNRNNQVHVTSSRTRRLGDENTKYCNQNSTWEEGVGRIYGNVMIVLSKKRHLHVTMGDGLAHFAVVRSKNKIGQRFLGFYIKDQQILSHQTHGIIGQFITKSVRLISPNTLAVNRNNTTENTVKVEVKRRNKKNQHKLSLVSGVLNKRRSLLEKTHVECIHIQGRGRGLLDGQPRDYLLECLRC
ncbi:inter-alpha-trypsin inhibitor heavy chain H3 isoform X2 [Procambarus clarkii]|uniref:inter-alpha-trypsin inhibitor heavy chain H3 isoform X2 n=1 Tax=Procambarus clarkii TaxID=6728 RepID=UPI001E678D44|nr:inter-alpha-trypsin inhibitor heavy chain H3-like isoform X2 [Procambarus clarkii]